VYKNINYDVFLSGDLDVPSAHILVQDLEVLNEDVEEDLLKLIVQITVNQEVRVEVHPGHQPDQMINVMMQAKEVQENLQSKTKKNILVQNGF
jgi:leucyl-tRNA synthetase